MDAARGTAFQQLVAGASFQRGRFGADIAKFKAKPLSPSVAPAAAPTTRHLPPLDFFADGQRQRDNASEPGSDAGSVASAAPSAGGSPQGGSPRKVELPPSAKAPMSRRRALRLREEHRIKASGREVPLPFDDFTQLAAKYAVPEYLQRNVFTRGFRDPTPVQMQALPCLLGGRDLLAVAPTGSGKTLAFLLPLLARLRRPSRRAGLRAVVLAHSKELAQQTERELRFLCRGRRWGVQTLQQSKRSVTRQDIIVSTPARLLSLVDEHHADLSKVLFAVFDEADVLFNEQHSSFLQAINDILRQCTHPDRVVAVFSATMPERAEGVIREVLRDPCRVMIGTRAAACRDVDQSLVYCGKEQGKMEAVRALIRKGVQPPVLVFVDKIDRAKDLYQELRVMRQSVAAIHSDRTAAQRDAAVQDFRVGRCHILVCTELMSRGVDFKGVGTVVNYDFPTSATSYVHRVGRTGRAGRKGKAVTLWTDDDKPLLRTVAGVIERAGGEVAPWMLQLPKLRGRGRRGGAAPAGAPSPREAISAVRRARDAEARQRRFARRRRPDADAEDRLGHGGTAGDTAAGAAAAPPRRKRVRGDGGGAAAPARKKRRRPAPAA